MMARLIDADKLLEIYKKWIPQLSSKEDEIELLADALRISIDKYIGRRR